MNTFSDFIRSTKTTNLLDAMIRDNRITDAKLAGVAYFQPCGTCSAPAEFIQTTSDGELVYQCEFSHVTLVGGH